MTASVEETYIVRKTSGELLPPGTFFVLSSSDRFAYAALWQYATVLQLALEIDRTISESDVARIRQIQATTEDMAARWQAAETT